MKENFLKKVGGKWIFLILVIILYLILALIDFPLAEKAVFGFLNLLKRILPIFALVLFFMFLSRLFLNAKKISKLLGEGAGLRGWILSITGGILSSGPIYMWYPLLDDLKKQGMRYSFVAAFLYNRAVKIPLLPIMIYYFGLSLVAILTFYMILFSVINGLLVERFLKIGSKRK